MTLQEYRARVAREKSAAVLDAALKLFLENGYDQTSMDAVARQANVSSATVYKHFKTKAELFGGIMERFWQNPPQQTPAMPNPGDPGAGLTAIGRAYARLLSDPNVIPLFRVVIAEASRFPELGEQLYRKGKEPYLRRLHAYLAEETKAATLEIADPATAARQFLGMINDVIFWPRLLVIGLSFDAEEAERIVAEAVKTFLSRYQARDPIR